MQQKKILMLVASDFEDSEVRQPLDALRQAGYTVELAGPEAGKVYRGKHNKETVTSTIAIQDVKPDQYDVLVIPGGYAPDHLRLVPHAVEIVRHFCQQDKPVAAVCHGPQLLISADALKGRKLACYASIVVDVRNAGGTFLDQPLVVDRNLITSRNPQDLPQFCNALLQLVKGQPVTASAS